MITLECEYCGNDYLAERISSKYCSDSCKTMAYRKRKAEFEQSLVLLKQKKLIEEANEKWWAEFNERNRIESIARQEQMNQEKIDRDTKFENDRLERVEKNNRERVLRQEKHKQRMCETKKRNSQNELIGVLLEGLANRIIENFSENNSKEESQDNSTDLNKK